jgi:hypothetical protein
MLCIQSSVDTVLGICCTRCVQYLVDDVLGECCTLYTRYSVLTLDHGIPRDDLVWCPHLMEKFRMRKREIREDWQIIMSNSSLENLMYKLN